METTEISSRGENGFAAFCLAGAIVYVVCKLKTWLPSEQEDEEREEKLTLCDLSDPAVDFMSTPIIHEGLFDHTRPLSPRSASPLTIYNVFLGQPNHFRPASPDMPTFHEMINGGGRRVGSGDFLDRLSVGTDHEIPAFDRLLKENNIHNEVPRSATPGSEVSVDSEVISRGSHESWDVLSV